MLIINSENIKLLGIGDWGLGPIPNPQYYNIIIVNYIFVKLLKR